MFGEHDLATKQLGHRLSIPFDVSTALLEVDPKWTPLRDDPRFKALLDKCE